MPYFIGLNVSHNCAAAAVHEGQLVMAIAGERIARVKHLFDNGEAHQALFYLLNALCITPADLSCLAASYGVFLPRWAKESDGGYALDYNLQGNTIKMRLYSHHLAHAAAGFFASGLDEALVMVSDAAGSAQLDGLPVPEALYLSGVRGELESISFYKASGLKLELLKSFHYPLSMGEFYSAITDYLGFNRHRTPEHMDFNEGRTMGLSPFGEQYFNGESMVFLEHSGFSFNREWIEASDTGLMLTNRFYERFGPPRKPGEDFSPEHMLAAYIAQNDLEKVIHYLIEAVSWRYKPRNLVLSGGTFHNSVLNGVLRRNTNFEHVFVFPAADDSGLAVGNAFLAEIDGKGSLR
ncbi:MAG: carbamoyltransferase N-terminal domain-containing protein [Candidatus Wallbacteria bacterium]|nr:carbamoyltransferase N-terminal domain-containing protein [Candidatus Wallbacteria bacterium]